jgi:hypothetical protein
MSKFFRAVKSPFQKRQHRSHDRSSISSQRNSSEEMEVASNSLIDSMKENPAPSLEPGSAITDRIDLGFQSAVTTYLQFERSVVSSKSERETVVLGSDLPVQQVSSSTTAAGSAIFDHCATNRSSAIHPAVNLVADILSATYSKCFIYPEGEFEFPEIRPVRTLVKPSCADRTSDQSLFAALCLAFARRTATRRTSATACICIRTRMAAMLKKRSKVDND